MVPWLLLVGEKNYSSTPETISSSSKSVAWPLAFPERLQGCWSRAGWEVEKFCHRKQWAAPSHCCTHSSAAHSGLKPFSSPSAKLSHLGRFFPPTAIRLFDSSFVIRWVLLYKVPYSSTSVYIFSIGAPRGNETPNSCCGSALLN